MRFGRRWLYLAAGAALTFSVVTPAAAQPTLRVVLVNELASLDPVVSTAGESGEGIKR